MMSDLIERLNGWVEDRAEARTWGGPTMYGPSLTEDEIREAAQAITALTAERDALIEALLEARGDMGAMGAMFNHYGFGKGQHLAGEGRSKIDDALNALKGGPANG